ncbi:hypothetical protein HMI54_011638 [Coelomomyces lativittatus]|nr:hypothetical protein HMI56_005921 [Coelomomyces lativittatus]KAJ1499605.1 hypothetical protein HMI54_011638 [Coelomomyces lativittatus]
MDCNLSYLNPSHSSSSFLQIINERNEVNLIASCIKNEKTDSVAMSQPSPSSSNLKKKTFSYQTQALLKTSSFAKSKTVFQRDADDNNQMLGTTIQKKFEPSTLVAHLSYYSTASTLQNEKER